MSHKTKDNLKILLIHIRDDQEMAKHEFKVVMENSGLKPENFTSYNVITQPPFHLKDLEKYDGVIIGGSGNHSALDNKPFIKFLEDIARYCKEKNIPFLGLCFGFHIVVNALGGKIICDKENLETGTYTMYRDHRSDNDPLIGDLPYAFEAACGRKDRAEILPKGMINYVWSDRCKYHYATYPDSKFFIVQFHPELWKKSDNLIRLTYYREKYGMDEEKFREQIKMFDDAPESRFIIKNFIDFIAKAD